MARTRGMGAGAASRSGDSRSPEREEGGDERRPYQSLGPVDDLLIAPWIKVVFSPLLSADPAAV
jgi:hypothetical protein